MSNLEASPATRVPRDLTEGNLQLWSTVYLAHLVNRPEAEIDLYRGLNEYGLDSMDAVVMAGEMEEHFGIEIDPAQFLRQASLGDLIAELCRPG